MRGGEGKGDCVCVCVCVRVCMFERDTKREIFPQHKRSTLAKRRHLCYLTEPQNNEANIVNGKEENIWLEKYYTVRTFLVVQWVRVCTPKAGGPGSIPGRGTRSCMHSPTKKSTCHN